MDGNLRVAKDWMPNERIPQIGHQLFILNILDASAASVALAVWMVSWGQHSASANSGPQCPIANMYLVLRFERKSMLRFNVIIAFELPRLSSHDLYDWICLLSLWEAREAWSDYKHSSCLLLTIFQIFCWNDTSFDKILVAKLILVQFASESYFEKKNEHWKIELVH